MKTGKGHVIAAFIALSSGDRATAQQELARLPHNPDDYWFQLGAWALAHFDADAKTANEALTRAKQLTDVAPDENRVSGIAYLQFWSIGLDQYFLPQVFNPGADPVAAYLIDWADKQNGTPVLL